MADNELKYILHGWDDEKIYFSDPEYNDELCVSDEDALMKELIGICKKYFLNKKNDRRMQKD